MRDRSRTREVSSRRARRGWLSRAGQRSSLMERRWWQWFGGSRIPACTAMRGRDVFCIDERTGGRPGARPVEAAPPLQRSPDGPDTLRRDHCRASDVRESRARKFDLALELAFLEGQRLCAAATVCARSPPLACLDNPAASAQPMDLTASARPPRGNGIGGLRPGGVPQVKPPPSSST